MAQIAWRTTDLQGGNVVRLTGKVKLSCGHSVSDGAQVRNNERAIEQGKETVRRLITTLTSEHVKECKK